MKYLAIFTVTLVIACSCAREADPRRHSNHAEPDRREVEHGDTLITVGNPQSGDVYTGSCIFLVQEYYSNHQKPFHRLGLTTYTVATYGKIPDSVVIKLYSEKGQPNDCDHLRGTKSITTPTLKSGR